MLRRQVLLTLGAAVTGGCLRLSQSENGAANGTTTRPEQATTTGGPQTATPEPSGPDREPDTVSNDGQPDAVSDDGQQDAVSDDDQPDAVGEDGGTDQPQAQSPVVDGQTGEYQFSAGEGYTYEAFSGEDISMEVTEVVGDQLTVRFSGPQSDGRVIEGTPEELFQPSGDTADSIARVFFGALRAGNVLAEGRSLTVGNSWTVTPDEVAGDPEQVDWETATAEVTGVDSHNGVSCATIEVTTDGEAGPTTYCINPEYPFAIAISDASGENTITFVERTTG